MRQFQIFINNFQKLLIRKVLALAMCNGIVDKFPKIIDKKNLSIIPWHMARAFINEFWKKLITFENYR